MMDMKIFFGRNSQEKTIFAGAISANLSFRFGNAFQNSSLQSPDGFPTNLEDRLLESRLGHICSISAICTFPYYAIQFS